MSGVAEFEQNNIDAEQRGDRELQRVMEFSQVLGSVASFSSITLSYESESDKPVQDAIHRFETYESIGIPTMYLEKRYEKLQGELSFDPRISRGGKRSFHGVFFGDLIIGDNEPIPLAVKPHIGDSALHTCIGEYVNNEVIRSMNFPNLSPVGFLVASRDRAYTFTIRDDLLTTLDSLDWSGFYPETENNPVMREMWDNIAQQVAILHQDGNRSHGDLAARNIAMTAEGGILIIDWEKARLNTQKGTTKDAEARYASSSLDLLTLVESITRPPHDEFKAGIGILYGKEVDWWQAFCDIFFDEYKATRLILAEQGPHHKRTETEVEEELEELENSLRLHIEMMQEVCSQIPPR